MAAYPGEGYNMSNYGLKKYTPEQMKEQWREKVDRERKVTKYHPASKNTEHHAKQLCTSQQSNYFNNDKKYETSSTYDRMFHVKEGYSSKLKRDDLQHTQGLLSYTNTQLTSCGSQYLCKHMSTCKAQSPHNVTCNEYG